MDDDLPPLGDVAILGLFAEAERTRKRLDVPGAAKVMRKGLRNVGLRRFLWSRRWWIRRRVRHLTRQGLLNDSGGAITITAEGRRTMLDALAAYEVADFMPPHLAQDREEDRNASRGWFNRRRGL